MINPGRTIVSDSLTKVIAELFGKNDVSERTIKNAWLEEISSQATLTYNGWYSPPEYGMAILASRGDNMERTHFKSFRDPQFFASSEKINWSTCSLTAYASNIDIETGLPADFATTMYFGNRKRVKAHLARSVSSCRTFLSEINEVRLGKELYLRMEDILAQEGIDGRTWSSTDNDHNFGHTLPMLKTGSEQTLAIDNKARCVVTDIGAEGMRTERVFLSSDSSLDLSSGIQFTIEPQCVSQTASGLPKVMMHYVVQFLDGKFQVCNACDDLPARYGLN